MILTDERILAGLQERPGFEAPGAHA